MESERRRTTSPRSKSQMASRQSLAAGRKTNQPPAASRLPSSSSHTMLDDTTNVIDVYSDYAESDDDGFEFPENFDEARTRRRLLRSRNCAKIVLSVEQQREMGIEIGVNVTAEHPWQQLKKSVLQDYLAYDTHEAVEFKNKLKTFDDDELILVGYAAALSEEQDTFLFFENSNAAQEAGVLISQIEASERRKARRAQIKQPRIWNSLGSEKEVEHMLRLERRPVVDVEIQSVYPMHHPHKAFVMRRAMDVCDGYAELVPRRASDFANVSRKRVDMHVQSAAPRVAVEQQTDPLFPANAWTQYLYEIGQDKVEEEVDEENDEPVIRKRGQQGPTIPIIPSDRVQELLDNLEFNEVNMYKNDYPAIGTKIVPKFQIPYLTEAFCFVDMSKSIGRVISSIDWHPVFSGLVVVSYAFTTASTTVLLSDKTDTISRSINQANHVIMWSFDEKLYPKLELETSREITCLSYCPYDENVLLGGTINGQLVVWDLKDRIKRIETEEVMTAAQARYRAAMRVFLNWTKLGIADRMVRPAALSSLANSHRGAVTSIEWLSRCAYVTSAGQVKLSQNPNYRYIVTSSMDCSVAYWDMDYVDEAAAKNPVRKLKLPAHLASETSEYERLNGVFRPQFMAVYNHPISGILLDNGLFSYKPMVESMSGQRKLGTRVKHVIKHEEVDSIDETILAGTVNGQIVSIKFEGSDMTSDLIKRFQIKNPERFENVHDGIVEAIKRNPFVHDLFLSVGRNVLVLWRLDLMWTPVFWRRCAAELTDVRWSKDRPSVFFVTRGDGTFEAWDIMTRTDAPCLKDSLGGSILTRVCQHKLTLPSEVVAVGDFNSSLRVFEIPRVFTRKLPNEEQLLIDFVQREVQRKETLHQWHQRFYDGNTAIREAMARVAAEAALELERLEKETREREDMRVKREEAEELRRLAKERARNVFDLPEKLEKKWDEMNIRRLMRILMAKKKVDPQLLAKWTAPEKLRQVYVSKQRAAIDESFAQTANDLAALRAALIPVEVPDEDRINLVKQNLRQIALTDDEETLYYEEVQTQAASWIEKHQQRPALDLAGILRRGRQRREVLNKSLGSNTQHRNTFYGGKNVTPVTKVEDDVDRNSTTTALEIDVAEAAETAS